MTTPVPRSYAGREWRHPSVHALMDGLSVDRDPEDVVRERARAMVDRARSMGWSGPPFDPVQLASIEGIRARPSDAPLEVDALIRCLEDGTLEIVWNQSAPITRRNFSICHELGHTLFPDAYEVVRFRSPGADGVDEELERLCDVAATELLMPCEPFASDLAERPLDASTLQWMGTRYAASPEATGRRMATLSTRPCAGLRLTHRLKPSEERQAQAVRSRARPRFRVDYVVASSSCAVRFPIHKSVPDDSCAYSAGDEPSFGAETWNNGKVDVKVHVHVVTIPSDSEQRARVFVLVVPQ